MFFFRVGGGADKNNFLLNQPNKTSPKITLMLEALGPFVCRIYQKSVRCIRFYKTLQLYSTLATVLLI